MNWLNFFETLFKVFPVLEKWIDLQILELPMKQKEHDEKTGIRETRLQRKLVKVRFKRDKRRKRIERKRDRRDVPILEEKKDNE